MIVSSNVWSVREIRFSGRSELITFTCWIKMGDVGKKNEFLPADRQVDPQVAGECRYVENDELRYSLRSVEKFAPWIRRVYIVTDDQTPAWLDTSNPRIRVVSHREIMPAEILPVFNSCTIELFPLCQRRHVFQPSRRSRVFLRLAGPPHRAA